MDRSEAEVQLSEMERDRLAVYVTSSPLPSWYWPFLGISTGLLLASIDLGRPLVTVLVVFLYSAGVGFALARVIQAGGVAPRLRGMPASLRRPLVFYMVASAAIMLPGVVLAWTSDAPWSFTALGGVAAVLIWVGGPLTARAYDARAERLAEAAGIPR